jgi:crotonobetainyl-CoA:carnitine CoA-transferase CaiB-like acyl-CoA transferase
VLRGVRVLDFTADIAGPYCSKLLADAGADVVKVEPTEGDRLRQWGSGALFEYLNASKRSIQGSAANLIAGAHIIVTDQAVEPEVFWAENPALVVVTVTPYGCEGPWVDHPYNEFTLQADCGSTGQRGLPEEPPLAAGGRLGEWITGTYGALGALAAYREASRSGRGEHVDVAMLDCMAVTMVTYPSVFASFAGWPSQPGTGRVIEVPSVEPTKDGFFVATTNSAQQFQDFLLMIGRPDLLADPELPLAGKRFARRKEFLSAVHEYTTQHTTDEVLEAAALYRIPAGPLLNGSTMCEFEQFVARGTFVPSPSGRFVQPRVPYRISGTVPAPFRPAPAPGQHTGTIDWSRPDHRELTPGNREHGSGTKWRLPLQGVRVVDCTAWWAGPAATNVLAGLGADVIKVESVTRPDLMRYSSTRPHTEDRWWEWGPLFHSVNVGKRGITLDLSRPEGIDVFEKLVVASDVLVENYTPRVMEQFGLDWDRLHAVNPELIMARMPAFGLDGPWRDRTGFAQTMECLTGMAWLTGFVDGPPVLVRGACDPLAAMHTVFAVVLALIERDQSGGGRLVEVAMVESVLNAAAEQVAEYGASGTLLCRDGNRSSAAAPQGVYPCAGDDQWVALAVTDDAQWRSLATLLGDPPWIGAALTHLQGRRAEHDRIDRELAAWTGAQSAGDVADRLRDVGVPAAVVSAPRDIATNPQLRSRHLFETEQHGTTGDHEIPMLPFRYSRVDHWMRSPSPTLGQHNEQVLGELGFQRADVDRLRRERIVGDAPAGL